MSTTRLRRATPADVSTILRFIHELAESQRKPHEVVATEAMIHEALFGPRPAAEVVLAENDSQPVGFALYFTTFSTWLGRPGLYLEDLYVTPEARGQGVGKQLLMYMAQLTVEREYGRLEWSVLNWNSSAIEFYQAAGAVPLDDSVQYRLSGEALARFAAR